MSKEELIEKINFLSPDDYELVVMLVNNLSKRNCFFQRLSEDELIDVLSASAEKSDAGHTKPAREFLVEMRDKYAF